MRVFDEGQLGQALDRLTPWRRIAFMVLCCERMVPNYEHFSREAGFGDTSILRSALDGAWTWLESERLPANLAMLQQACERQAPNTENFQSRYTSAAVDAANAVSAVLDAIEQPDQARPVEVASLARDTIDLFVQEIMNLDPNKPGFEREILRHDLMQAELSQQWKDLAQLEHSYESRLEAARGLRANARGTKLGSLT